MRQASREPDVVTLVQDGLPSKSGESLPSLDAILAVALDAVITIDEDGRICELNQAAERVFGYCASGRWACPRRMQDRPRGRPISAPA
jgi:PAS domain-containing protein